MDRTPPPDRRRTRSQAAGDALLAILNHDLHPAYANVHLMNNPEEEVTQTFQIQILLFPIIAKLASPNSTHCTATGTQHSKQSSDE